MELRQYWAIIQKRLWIPLALVLVVAVASLVLRKTPPPVYSQSISFVVGVQPERVPGQFNYDGYYAGLSSEYVADDLSVIVTKQVFAEDVNKRLAEAGSSLQIPPGIFSGMTYGDKQHRILRLTITWADPAELQAIGQAVITALKEDSARYLTTLGTFGAQVMVIDGPTPPAPVGESLTQKLDLPVRLLLAFAAGLGLIFLLHYLDTSVASPADLAELGIPVLAEIPRRKNNLWGF